MEPSSYELLIDAVAKLTGRVVDAEIRCAALNARTRDLGEGISQLIELVTDLKKSVDSSHE